MKTKFNSSAVRNEVATMQINEGSNTLVKPSQSIKIEKGYLYLVSLGVGLALVLIALNSLGLMKGSEL